MRIVLASTSKTRQLLLAQAGVAFDVHRPDVDEAGLKSRNAAWRVDDIALHLAQAKAVSSSLVHPQALVIGADQTLVMDGRCYDKPPTLPAARDQLLALRGRSHALHSAICCARAGETLWRHTDAARLTMRAFSQEFLHHYLESVGEECTTSVGAYKLEGLGIQLFETVEGSYHTILGLPLLPLLAYLRSEGLLLQ